ncbi:LIM domain only protein 7 [Varanus komodoensis]|nr:LIM domain only protein 7 [Varanus komodoensis]
MLSPAARWKPRRRLPGSLRKFARRCAAVGEELVGSRSGEPRGTPRAAAERSSLLVSSRPGFGGKRCPCETPRPGFSPQEDASRSALPPAHARRLFIAPKLATKPCATREAGEGGRASRAPGAGGQACGSRGAAQRSDSPSPSPSPRALLPAMEERADGEGACYDAAFAEARRWVEAVTGKSFGDKDFRAALENGVLLCDLINKIKPGIIKKINRLSTPIAGLDNINVFLKACENLGLKEAQLFHPGDLQDLSNRVTVKYMLTFEMY